MTTSIHARYIRQSVLEDLLERMVFVGGPRQVGKTTFALSLLSEPTVRNPAYLNWDDVRSRASLMRGELPPDQPLVVLDEIHKFARWRNLVKGFFDMQRGERSFLVVGSARLDYYRRGGDSLQGRYHYHRLHPFSLPELDPECGREALDLLFEMGGFPEPLFRGDARFWRRWQRERTQRVIYDDLRNLENVREISLLELLAAELPVRVGAPISVKNLRDILEVAHETAERWLTIFERLYFCFRIPPFGTKKIRAVKKEQKLYLWDWSLVQDRGARFENLVASHLLKYCHLVEDTEGWAMDLRYIRDTDSREVDFVVLKDSKPLFAVECKVGERNISKAIPYFAERTPIPRFFQVHMGHADYEKAGVRVLPFATFCREMELV
ncbi:MAG: ATP-binding protein [Thermoanaerobaculales bacterium]|nr:ATP-binding protein [Thermoanaerobaculales bacterium]